MDYVALRNELLTDPLGLGYGPLLSAGNDTGAAALINAPVAGEYIFDGVMPARVLFELCDKTEYAALTADKKQLLFGILGMGEVDLTGDNARAALEGIFGNPSNTRTNIINKARRLATRAEMLFGLRVRVADLDIAIAIRG